jgi:hypothetical protein
VPPPPDETIFCAEIPEFFSATTPLVCDRRPHPALLGTGVFAASSRVSNHRHLRSSSPSIVCVIFATATLATGQSTPLHEHARQISPRQIPKEDGSEWGGGGSAAR